ncbi:MAG: iron-containing alcohol dehydrogenase [Oscillospiraceae bacterium]|nr:iron-containing alcohol dehydrogenase [Oscillospiraceae bacterium]
MSFKMYVPTRNLFGCGMLSRLHKQKLPGKRAMLVISNGKSTRANGYLARTEQELQLAGTECFVFDQIEPNPRKATVMAGAAFARANACDFVVALGGGSVMDASKLIALMAANDGDLWDYVSGGTGKGQKAPNRPLPVVCITTTAGTGSEIDQWGVITNELTHEKIGCGGMDSLFPVLAIVDPELMTSVPPKFTAYQGFDALFHATECYLSRSHNLMSDMYALTAIENLASYLPIAVRDGNNLEARERVAFGNNLSGVVMTISNCTSEHSMEHAMSAYHQDLPHGAGLIMISLAYYAHFVAEHICDERFIRMAQAMGARDADKPEDFLTALEALQRACGVAELKMSDFGIDRTELDDMAKNARETMGALFSCDPCPMSHAQCVAIYEKSYR